MKLIEIEEATRMPGSVRVCRAIAEIGNPVDLGVELTEKKLRLAMASGAADASVYKTDQGYHVGVGPFIIDGPLSGTVSFEVQQKLFPSPAGQFSEYENARDLAVAWVEDVEARWGEAEAMAQELRKKYKRPADDLRAAEAALELAEMQAGIDAADHTGHAALDNLIAEAERKLVYPTEERSQAAVMDAFDTPRDPSLTVVVDVQKLDPPERHATSYESLTAISRVALRLSDGGQITFTIDVRDARPPAYEGEVFVPVFVSLESITVPGIKGDGNHYGAADRAFDWVLPGVPWKWQGLTTIDEIEGHLKSWSAELLARWPAIRKMAELLAPEHEPGGDSFEVESGSAVGISEHFLPIGGLAAQPRATPPTLRYQLHTNALRFAAVAKKHLDEYDVTGTRKDLTRAALAQQAAAAALAANEDLEVIGDLEPGPMRQGIFAGPLIEPN